MSEGSSDVLVSRVSSVRWSAALALSAFLLNAAIVVFLVGALFGSVQLALITLGVMAGAVLIYALYFRLFHLSAVGARPLLPNEYPWLEPIVDDLAARASIPAPPVLLVDVPVKNAFTTGTGHDAKVVFFAGLLDELSEDEVRAVAAHELGHVINKDVGLLVWISSVSAWVSLVSAVAVAAAYLIFDIGNGLFRSLVDENPIAWLFAPVAWMLFAFAGASLWLVAHTWGLISHIASSAVSRQREFLADATSVALTGEPSHMITALAKSADNPYFSRGATLAGRFCILSPRPLRGWLDDVAAAHPSVDKRIAELDKLRSVDRPSLDENWEGIGSSGVMLPVGSLIAVVLLAISIPLLMNTSDSGYGGGSSISPQGGFNQNPIAGNSPPSRTQGAAPTALAANSTPTDTPAPTPRPTPIDYGTDLTGTIDEEGEVDRYSFVGEEDDIITIRMLQDGGASLDPAFSLVDPSGEEIADECERYGNVKEPRLQNHKLQAAGSFTLSVGGCSGESTGGYRIIVTLKPPPVEITYGQEVTGEIALTGDYTDWKFTGNVNDIITIRMQQEGGASLPPKFSLFDPSDAEVADECDPSGSVQEARLQNFRLLASGTYTIRARGCFGDDLGGYRVSLALKPPPGAIAYGQEATGQITLNRDYDFWEFTGSAGDVITIRLSQDGGATLDPKFRLIDPSEAEEAGDCDPSGSVQEAVLEDHVLRFSGTYTIRVSDCFDDGTGGYRLSLVKG